MRRKLALLAVLLVAPLMNARAQQLVGFFPIAPQLYNLPEWDGEWVTEGFRDRLHRVRLDSGNYTYYLQNGWSNNPAGKPSEYISGIPSSMFVFIVTHSNTNAFSMTYWDDPAERNA